MKRQILLIVLFIAACFGTVTAQVSMMQDNINVQPIWGPVGYDHVSYYYLPDIDVYYDVPNRQYVYYEDNNWVKNTTLPDRFAKYDLYHSYKAVINDPEPWLHHDRYKRKYERYKHRQDQKIIRESHENKYRANPDHPEHSKWRNVDNSNTEQHFEDDPHGGHHE